MTSAQPQPYLSTTESERRSWLLYSFSAYSHFPQKLATNISLIRQIHFGGRIPPYHVLLLPTNRCNQACPFCDQRFRDRTQELPFQDIRKIVDKLAECGCRAIAFSGGGEPLLHPNIEEAMEYIHRKGIQIAMTTNGLLLPEYADLTKYLTWCRISFSDWRILNDAEELSPILKRPVDWGFNYVYGLKPRIREIRKLIEFGAQHNVVHIRVTTDYLQSKYVSVEKVRKAVNLEDVRVWWAPKKVSTHGAEKCWLSLLKPIIAADGYVYPCCGANIRSLENPSYYFDEQSRMKYPATEIDRIYREQAYFDGSGCTRCFYNDYNRFLSLLQVRAAHEHFI